MKESYKKYKKLIPLVIFTALALYTLASSIAGIYSINMRHYAAFLAAAVNWVVFFYRRPYYKYVLSITLILGLLNLLSFTFLSTESITFHMGSVGLTFQPTSLIICIITVLTNLPKKEDVVVIASQNVSTHNQKQLDEDIVKFKNIYENKSSDDLMQLIVDKRYTGAAIDAAKQILTERQNQN
jgi:hypothetical protein